MLVPAKTVLAYPPTARGQYKHGFWLLNTARRVRVITACSRSESARCP